MCGSGDQTGQRATQVRFFFFQNKIKRNEKINQIVKSELLFLFEKKKKVKLKRTEKSGQVQVEGENNSTRANNPASNARQDSRHMVPECQELKSTTRH